MEKTNKVMRIILSVVTFVAIALAIIGVLALPLQAKIEAGKVTASANIYDFIDGIIQMAKAPGPYSGSQIALLLLTILATVFTLVFGIIAIVKGIILLVKTIKGMSGKGEVSALLKSLSGFGVIIIVYIGLLLGVIYDRTSEVGGMTLGSGSEMMLSSGIIALAVAGAYHIANKDEVKLVNKLLGLGAATLMVVAIIVGLAATVSYNDGNSTTGLFIVIPALIGYTASGSTPDTAVVFRLILALFGMVIILVSLGFGKSVITNVFRAEKKDADYEKSSIVKSALFFGFSVLGFVLIAIGLSAPGFGYSMGAGAIVSMVFGAGALALSIVNKALFKKPEAPKAE